MKVMDGDEISISQIRPPTNLATHVDLPGLRDAAAVVTKEVGPQTPAFELLAHNECIIQNTTQLKSFLGRGEFSEVWCLSHEDMRTKHAVKKVQLRNSNDSHRTLTERTCATSQFEHELKHLTILRHQHIVALHAAMVSNDRHVAYLVFSVYPWGSLRNYNKNNVLTGRDLATIVDGVSQALKYMHEHHHYHQNITSDNILIDEYGQGILSDFGVCEVLQEGVEKVGSWYRKDGYMAPEAKHKRLFCPYKMDMYSLGATLWSVIYHKEPPLCAMGPVPFCEGINSYFRTVLRTLLDKRVLRRWTAWQLNTFHRKCFGFTPDLETLQAWCVEFTGRIPNILQLNAFFMKVVGYYPDAEMMYKFFNSCFDVASEDKEILPFYERVLDECVPHVDPNCISTWVKLHRFKEDTVVLDTEKYGCVCPGCHVPGDSRETTLVDVVDSSDDSE